MSVQCSQRYDLTSLVHDLTSFLHVPLDTTLDGDLDTLDLLGHHRQHFQLNTVELIEARPGARLSKSLEELAHGFVIETI